MVLKVPRLNSSPLALCDRPFSLLGFGDILVPGKECDIIKKRKRIFYFAYFFSLTWIDPYAFFVLIRSAGCVLSQV